MLSGSAIDLDDGAGRHFDLPATGLDDRVRAVLTGT